MSELASCRIEVIGIEPVVGCGALLAIGNVAVSGYSGFLLQGCQIRVRDGKYVAQSPRWRHPRTGLWLPSFISDNPALTDALGAELVADAGAMKL
jgi:hypothetical protein